MSIILPFLTLATGFGLAGIRGGAIRPQTGENPYAFISSVPPPAGFHRLDGAPQSFGRWLQHFPLKKDRTVYLFNGRPKAYQQGCFAVLDLSTGHSDLQQCADAILRLRAEYLMQAGKQGQLVFAATNGDSIRYSVFAKGGGYRLLNQHLRSYFPASGQSERSGSQAFSAFLNTVFRYCGTLSLNEMLVRKHPVSQVEPGDVLIRAGSPGHAVLVMDVAIDVLGRRRCLLAQGFMPAQDMHLLLNARRPNPDPWFALYEGGSIQTPEWEFYPNQLKSW